MYKKRLLPLAGLVVLIQAFMLVFILGPSVAQNNTTTLAGTIVIVHGDPMPGSDEQAILNIFLADDNGDYIAKLDLDYTVARNFMGQRVEVTTNSASPIGQQSITPMGINNITGAQADPNAGALTGSQPFVNLLCKFAGNNAERPSSSFDPLFSNNEPGLNHYWQQISYGNINIDGTDTINTWVTLPQSEAYYTNAGSPFGPRLDQLARDCMNAANSQVFFPDFVGINIMLNGNLGCCAWGGTLSPITIDGSTRQYRFTWNPPWAQVYSVLAHEMGHAFGLPHSSGPADNPPSGLNIYVSQWDVMSNSEGTCSLFTSGYGCWAPGTIAYYVDLDGWIPANRRVTVRNGRSQTITLDRLRQPPTATNPLIAIVPINSSSNHFYTVEARFNNAGYDRNIPGSAVIIHEVLANRSPSINTGPALLVDANDGNDNVNDGGAMWKVGETYTDVANDITISVDSVTGSSFTVTITNNAPAPPPTINPIADQSVMVDDSQRVNVNTNDNNATIGFQVWAQDGRSIPANSPFYTARDSGNGTGFITFTARPGNVADSPYDVTVSAMNSDGSVSTETFSIEVEQSRPPVFTPIDDQTMEVRETLPITAMATDPDGDAITFRTLGQANNLDFVTWDGTDTITFEPTISDAGTYTIIIEASDGNSTKWEVFELTVEAAPNEKPDVTPIPDQTVEVGEQTTVTVMATDADGDDIFYRVIRAASLPDFITWDGTDTFTIAPRNSDVGNYFVTVEASDGVDRTWERFEVIVEGNQPPEFTPIGDVWVRIGTTKTVTVEAIDPEDEDITYRVIRAASLPDFITWDGTDTFTISPQVGDNGSYQVTVQASDGVTRRWETFNVRVINP